MQHLDTGWYHYWASYIKVCGHVISNYYMRSMLSMAATVTQRPVVVLRY